jgi:hypothetical protein
MLYNIKYFISDVNTLFRITLKYFNFDTSVTTPKVLLRVFPVLRIGMSDQYIGYSSSVTLLIPVFSALFRI